MGAVFLCGREAQADSQPSLDSASSGAAAWVRPRDGSWEETCTDASIRMYYVQRTTYTERHILNEIPIKKEKNWPTIVGKVHTVRCMPIP